MSQSCDIIKTEYNSFVGFCTLYLGEQIGGYSIWCDPAVSNPEDYSSQKKLSVHQTHVSGFQYVPFNLYF